MKVLCIIPARYASTRLPGKPLADIVGKPMIQHVYERACKAKLPSAVIVATDSQLVYDAVRSFDGRVMMTSPDHPTGTDRLAEVAEAFPEIDIIVNIQGDEPLIEPAIIDEVAQVFQGDAELQMATVMTPMTEAEYHLPGAVKVVTDKQGYALYFSRSLIPYPRSYQQDGKTYKHIGIYAYRREFLMRYAKMEPTPLERTESLEQLRALENGYRIKVIKTDFRFIGVDTPEDLAEVNKMLTECVSKNTLMGGLI